VHHWYDGNTHFVAAACKVIKKLCDLAAILSVFHAWVPGLGEVLLAMAAIGAVLDFISAGVALLHGGSWSAFLLAGVGVVMTIFGGKMLELGMKGMKGVMVARAAKALERDGADVDRGLRALQGVGAHSSEDYMTASKAIAAKNELKEAFSSVSGFKTATAKAFKESFTHTEDGFGDAMKGAFSPRDLSNSDLVSAYKMAIKDPSLLDSKLVVHGLAVTGIKVADDVRSLNQGLQDHKENPYAIPGIEGPGAITDLKGAVTDVVDANRDFVDAAKKL
jgi:hypothetical protein